MGANSRNQLFRSACNYRCVSYETLLLIDIGVARAGHDIDGELRFLNKSPAYSAIDEVLVNLQIDLAQETVVRFDAVR